MRFLLDTCVVVSALRSRRGASNLLVRRALEGSLPIVMHYKLLSEYIEVTSRMCRAREIAFPWQQVERLLGAMVSVAEIIEVRYLWRPNLRDEGDNFVYEIAFAASPCTIVTHNTRDFGSGELQWAGVSIKTPQSVLQEV